MTVAYTPMIEQYREIKRQHPNEILFFRLGDFYEMFFEDAEIASRELEITLTGRDGGADKRVPMCGVPYHAAETYLNKLLQKGFKVAICEQVEDPKEAKGIVKREVIKIVTPGTNLSENYLQDKLTNYLALLFESADEICLTYCDITTGECSYGVYKGHSRYANICDQLFKICPAELLLMGEYEDIQSIHSFISSRIPNCIITTLNNYDIKEVESLPLKHFPDKTFLSESSKTAVGLLLYYLHNTVKSELTHINTLTENNNSDYLLLDAFSLRNLEITRNMRDGSKTGTLLSVLDFTRTAMGTRELKKWLEAPLASILKINQRLDAVEELVTNHFMRSQINEQLKEIYDIERILTRIDIGSANARDLVALRTSLKMLPEIKNILLSSNSLLIKEINSLLKSHSDIFSLLSDAIVDEPPFSVRDGGFIKTGYDTELDELRTISTDSKAWINNFEAELRQTTNIKNLKVGFNKVFGYYIEVTKANIENVPDYFVRKQTLVNAERYITPELKEFETKILGAQEKIVNLEYHLFTKIREQVKNSLTELQLSAKQLAVLDALQSLAEAAVKHNYVRPQLVTTGEITIKEGRHPVVERLLYRELFVPNDTYMNQTDREMIIITGPNMAGKSTYMRQVALLVLMAQAGSFLPARQAVISPVDRIFTRVGASDDLATGQSTFMVEMNEVSHILKNATGNSLIVLDEIGRGTSTYDGMSIARAVVEYILQKIKAKTLFATHYHELTVLENEFKGVVNASVAVKEKGNDVVFLRRIVAGGADKSYGVHVAKLAGLPRRVIERAQEILADMEQTTKTTVNEKPEKQIAATKNQESTINLFACSLTAQLLNIDIMSMTPIEALNTLYKLQEQARQEAGIT